MGHARLRRLVGRDHEILRKLQKLSIVLEDFVHHGAYQA